MSGTLPCRADTQCRPRFGDIWRCRRHVADMSPTCGAKVLPQGTKGKTHRICTMRGSRRDSSPLSWVILRDEYYSSVDVVMLRRSDGGDRADVSHFSSSRVAAVVVNEGLAANEGVTFLCKRQINYRHCRHHHRDQQEHCLWMQYPYYLFFSVVWWCVWRAFIIR